MSGVMIDHPDRDVTAAARCGHSGLGLANHDIAAARACGAVACAVATGSEPAEALAEADVVFASLAELPAWHAARYGAAPAVTAPAAPRDPADR